MRSDAGVATGLTATLAVLTLLTRATGGPVCEVTQYRCDNGACVSVSQYCDGVVHCSDYSDEPPGCTVCNRTYYGQMDHTYQLEVPAPPASRAGPPAPPSSSAHPLLILLGGVHDPQGFKCVLTFSALGHDLGDIVQVTFAEFHVGHFNTSAVERGPGGCQGDHVSIEEAGLATRGGRWCGEGSGLNVYYSETSTVQVTLHAASTTQGEYFDNPLRFKIRYKFLPRATAVVRYGGPGGAKYRGQAVRNTVCSRVFQGCRARRCRLQSPNFPGLYPRNVTCYYLVKAQQPPRTDLSAVVTLRQDNDRLVQVGRQGPASRVSPESRLLQGRECVAPEDFLLVYDGGSMKAPLLAKLCGTARLPNITSSGPELLLVFQTATSGLMNHLPNLVTGFELDAHVSWRRHPASQASAVSCRHSLKSFGGGSGSVLSPGFAAPANASCTYEFEGRRGERVWIYFSKYYRAREKHSVPGYHPCRNRLAIYDGPLPEDGVDTPLMAEFCDEQLPPICVRTRQRGTVTQPCTLRESFLSSGMALAVTQEFTDGTSLLPLQYVMKYEFVIVAQEDREPGTDCDRVFNSDKAGHGHFNSPKNVFLYGRGGKSSLLCRYTFRTRPGEAVRLRVTAVGFRANTCKTVYNFHTNLYECIARLPGSATLEVWEQPWPGTRLPLGCVCDGGVAPATFLSHTDLVTLHFAIKDMGWNQDFNDSYFDADYEFVSTAGCQTDKMVNGSTGAIRVGRGGEEKKESEEEEDERQEDVEENEECDQYPWRITARDHSHLYLSIPGYHASSQRCSSRNRVVVYGSHTATPLRAACPERGVQDRVEVFSSGWGAQQDAAEPLPESLIIRYLRREPGSYTLTWLEVRREPRPSALESLKGGSGRRAIGGPSCGHLCPHLDACINPELWCDGVPHCPSGADELQSTCLYFTVPWLYLAAAAAAVVLLLVLAAVALAAARVYRRGKLKRKKKKEAQRLMTREVILPMNFHKEIY